MMKNINVQVFNQGQWFKIEKETLKDVVTHIIDKKTTSEANYLLASLLYYKSLISAPNKFYLYDINDGKKSQEKTSFLEMMSLPFEEELVFYKHVEFFKDELRRENWVEKKRKKCKEHQKDLMIPFSVFDRLVLYLISYWDAGYKIVCTYNDNKSPISLKEIRKCFELERMEDLVNHNVSSMLITMPDWINILIYVNNVVGDRVNKALVPS